MTTFSKAQIQHDPDTGEETGKTWPEKGLSRQAVLDATGRSSSDDKGWVNINYYPEADADYPANTHASLKSGPDKTGDPTLVDDVAVYPVIVKDYATTLTTAKGDKMAELEEASSERMGWSNGRVTTVWIEGAITDEDGTPVTYKFDLGPKGWNRTTGRRDQLAKKDEKKPEDAPHMKGLTVLDPATGIPVKLQVSVAMLDQVMEVGEAVFDAESDSYHVKVGQVLVAATLEDVDAV